MSGSSDLLRRGVAKNRWAIQNSQNRTALMVVKGTVTTAHVLKLKCKKLAIMVTCKLDASYGESWSKEMKAATFEGDSRVIDVGQLPIEKFSHADTEC